MPQNNSFYSDCLGLFLMRHGEALTNDLPN